MLGVEGQPNVVSKMLSYVINTSLLCDLILLFVYYQTVFTPDADATGKPNMTEVSKLDTGSQLCSSINISADVSDFQQTYVADY